jgi:hypothetical protein
MHSLLRHSPCETPHQIRRRVALFIYLFSGAGGGYLAFLGRGVWEVFVVVWQTGNAT